jgi:hypothetical protein
MNRLHWMMWLVLFVPGLVPMPVLSQESRTAARSNSNSAFDHPMGLVAFASVDRLKARSESLAEVLGHPGAGTKLLMGMVDGDEGIAKLLNSPGLDSTRPIGAMFYPNWFAVGEENPDVSKFDTDELTSDPLNFVVEGMATIFVENSTLVLCVPCKDRDVLLAVVQEILGHQDKALKSVEEQPGFFRFGDDEDLRIGFAHGYLLVIQDECAVKQFDRNYPDFAGLARSSLGKNGFVYALYRKGLPLLVRDVMGPAFKMVFAARFQQQDEESEIEFRMRTMSGNLQMQLLDLAISHVEEFRITGHVDSATRSIHVEPELIGAKGGKLARFFGDIKLGSSLFANQPTEDAVLAASMTLPLSAKDWKPTVEALYSFARTLENRGSADVIRAFARTIESGQFELYSYNPNWNEGLIALRISGGEAFPEQFQEMLGHLSNPPPFQVAFDSVDGVPIHQTLTNLDTLPALALLAIPFQGLFGVELNLPGLGEPAEETEVEYQRIIEEERPDGTKHLVHQGVKGKRPGAKNAIWLAVTPKAVFVGFGSSGLQSAPDWFKGQVAASLLPGPTTNRTPFKVTLRGIGAHSENELQKVNGQGEEGAGKVVAAPFQVETAPVAPDGTPAEGRTTTTDNSDQATARGKILRDFPNAIHCGIRPTETGVKLSVVFEEAYFHWFAAVVNDSMNKEVPVEAKPVEGKRPEVIPPAGN